MRQTSARRAGVVERMGQQQEERGEVRGRLMAAVVVFSGLSGLVFFLWRARRGSTCAGHPFGLILIILIPKIAKFVKRVREFIECLSRNNFIVCCFSSSPTTSATTSILW